MTLEDLQQEVAEAARKAVLKACLGVTDDAQFSALDNVDRSTMVLSGAVVATAILGAPINTFDIAHEFGMRVNDSDRDEHSMMAWPMLLVQPLVPPVEAKGAQGFWVWDGKP